MRWMAILVAAAIAAALALVLIRGGKQSTPAASQAAALDERVVVLYDPSLARGGYSVDLADMTSIQIETLCSGELDPMKRAKTELANDGERGIDAVRRLIARYRTDPAGVDYLRNAADVLAQSPEPSATPLLVSLLDHPSESLRMQSLRALLVHPRPEAFEPALKLLASAPGGYQAEVCAALGKLDPLRAQKLWMSWIENGDNRHVWQSILPLLGTARDPELTLRASQLLERDNLELVTRIWLCAVAARAGDVKRNEGALAELKQSRESKNSTERDLALRALVAAEHFDELSWTLEHDDLASLRLFVVRCAAAASDRGDAHKLLDHAALDADSEVRVQALRALANLGGGAALDEALQLLQSPSPLVIEAGIQILRERMDSDSALAERVWKELEPRLESIEQRPSAERAMFLKILGQIPARGATKRLIAFALTRREELEGTRAQRFILKQSVNAGALAQDELFQLWRTSDDELVRMDALEAFSALGGAHSRELLLAVLDDPRATAVEIVYLADRLVRIGPAREVAWQLKRASLRIEEPHAREALQGILWRWYPAPKR